MSVIPRSLSSLITGVMLLLLAICAMAIASSSHNLAAAPTECRVVIAMDRSGSIGDNWSAYRGQVLNLFDPTGLNRSDIYVAFWTFSHVPDTTGVNAGVNYNAPYHDYVQSTDRVGANDFGNSLPTNPDAVLGGQTNYAQGFGYDATQTSPLILRQNQNSDIRRIASQANVIAFLTDGAPNYPGGSDENNDAVAAGHAARTQYAPSIPVLGGYINADPSSTFVPLSLYRTINGNTDTSATNIGPVTGGFGNLTSYLIPKIQDACNIDLPNYSLTPVVNVDNNAVKTGDTVNFSYSVGNDTSDGSTGTSAWKLYDVTIKPEVQGNPLNFTGAQSGCTSTSGKPYCDSVQNCGAILGMINGKGTCDEVPAGGRGTCGANPSTSPGSGSYGFKPGPNDSDFYSPPRCQTIADLPLGTRVCSILALAQPGGGAANRISNAACVTVGKTPLVQIHGGDLRVGGRLNGVSDSSAGVYTSQFRITEDASVVPSGRTYGSWVEYGVLAPGPVKKFASLSGFAGLHGGYDSQVASSGCDQNINILTFANKVSDPANNTQCGYLSENPSLIPDMVSALTTRTPIDPASYAIPLQINGSTVPGLYKNAGPNFEISGGLLDKGKTVVVYVPNGTITVSGNINYKDDPSDKYTKITDIPQIVLIAKDINIKEGVNHVDAWLVATGNGSSGGTIDTCAGFVRPLSTKVCTQQLTINGPVIARQLNLWRTKVDETGCKIVAVQDCASAGDPAEIINLPGSSILWAKGYGSNVSRAQTTYTTELPPFF